MIVTKKHHNQQQRTNILSKFEPYREITFGVRNIVPQPSMFEILTWTNDNNRDQRRVDNQNINPNGNYSCVVEQNKQVGLARQKSEKGEKERIMEKKSEQRKVNSNGKRKIERPITADLYQTQNVIPVLRKSNKQESPRRNASSSPLHKNPYTKPKHQNNIVKKPPFAAYGRGNTHTQNQQNYMKSHSVLPHSGNNKPKKNQTYQSAIIGAKRVHPELVDDPPAHNDKAVVHFDLPQKKSDQPNVKKGKKQKPKPEPPLKFMNRRGDFIQKMRQEKARHCRLALKPTECYPGEYNVKPIDLAQSHCSAAPAAGKRNADQYDIREIFVYPPYI